MADQFFYKRDPNAPEQGPIDAKTLKKLAHSGQLLPDSQLRRGDGDWVAASSVKGLFAEAVVVDPNQANIPEAVPVEAPPAGSGGITLPNVVPKKAAPELPSGLDSLVVGGKRKEKPAAKAPDLAISTGKKSTAKEAPPISPAKVATKKPPEAKPEPVVEPKPTAEPKPEPAEAAPVAEPPENPFAGDSRASRKPHRKVGGGLGSLFSFDAMIGPTVIKTLFYLATALTLLGWMLGAAAIVGVAVMTGAGTIGLIVAGAECLFGLLVACMGIIVYRVIAEIVISFFMIHEDVRDLRQLAEEKSGVID